MAKTSSVEKNNRRRKLAKKYANKRAKEFERFPAVKIIVKEADGVKPKPEDFRKEKL